MKVYLNVDEEGNIIESFGGVTGIIPMKEYNYEFDVQADVLTSIHRYQVVDGILVERDRRYEMAVSINKAPYQMGVSSQLGEETPTSKR